MLAVLILFLAFVVLLVLGMAGARAQEGTWRFGSPNDVRQAGIWAVQHYGGDGYGRHGGCPNPVSTWMDIAFRAGSPQLYRYTQPQPPQINVYNNVTIYGGGYQGNDHPVDILDYVNRRDQGTTINYHVPRYPAAAVP